MNTRQELIDKLNALSITENEGLPYDIPQDIRKENPGLERPVADGIDPDEHRWFVMATTVFDHNGEYIGVRTIETIKSESTDRSDICNTLEFYPVRKVLVESFEKE